MKIRKAVIGFLLITLLYLGMLIWVDSKNHVLNSLPLLAHAVPVLMAFSLVSYIFRYLRWRWLLSRLGIYIPWCHGFLAYIAGFAFTATPGKVGELIRIRYFSKFGVPPEASFGAFVYERALDLIVVLMLASLAISRLDLLLIALSFTVIFIGVLAIFAFYPGILSVFGSFLLNASRPKLSSIVLIARDGLASCRSWFTPLDLIISCFCGLVAWGITSYGFLWLLGDLGVLISPFPAFSIYPLAMLAGAASMMPGGVGSTELTIIILLDWYGVALPTAALAAVGIRFATIWFAVLAGFSCLGVLEFRPKNLE